MSRSERGVKAESLLIETIFSCHNRVRHSLKVRDTLPQVSGWKRHKYGLNGYAIAICDGYYTF
ncbi:hypothetical protein AHT95_08845 [Salmonella enterica subsp. enterica]|nr:hypothetical protein [Salmonella enterica]EBS3047743.1 hypothetical protein [Salmonella enterica subsp. enterica serovar Tchad]EBU6371122.1 hypothetical protein [Salmonella enterica subsp. enterica serovar Okatie]EBW2430110.1 hypothetical protein [Salmonella enterica subsp. enterica serovar Brancaster]EBY8744215.1 hypothetical protein [Salmonella enterica subsp. enterica serovar Waycross]ECD4880301.1 hypothetical protein [Salmonella enterica subsp. enterica serovar Coleypark]ECV3918373.1 h